MVNITQTLHQYLSCVVLSGDYEGQETDCSNAVAEGLSVTHIVVGYEAPKTLEVAFKANGFPDIKAKLRLRHIKGQVGLYERA